MSLREFQELSWLVGRWHGSGGSYPAFYEQYSFRDDSTIAMAAFTDSTFQVVTADSAVIEWRNGRVQSRSPRSTNELVDFAPGRIRFRRLATADGGHQFTRVSPTEWTATLYPRGVGRDTVIYHMRRLGPPRP